MTNPYYARLLSIQPGTTARSAAVLAEFDRLVTSFDTLNTAAIAPLLARFNFGSNTFNFTGAVTLTGDVALAGATKVTVPTPSLADTDLTKAASLQYVHNVLGAAGSLVPTQTGHAGKFLKTDGAVYSWQRALPVQTGQAGKYLRSTGADGAESWSSVVGLGVGGVVTYSTTANHTGDATILVFSGAPAGTVLTLPDARTLPLDTLYWVSRGDTNVGVATNDGELLAAYTSTGGLLSLADNSTQAGSWRSASSPGANLNAITGARSLAGAEATFKASKDNQANVQIDDTRVLCVSSSASGNSIEAYVVSLSGLALTPGTSVQIGTDGAIWIKLVAVTGGYLLVYATGTSGAIKCAGLTVSGTTVTAGSVTSVAASIASFLSRAPTGVYIGYNDIDCDAAGNTALIAYRKDATTRECIAVNVSGTTCLVGAPVTLYTVGGGTLPTNYEQIRLLALSATSFVAIWTHDTNGAAGVMVSVTGISPTVNTPLAFTTGHCYAVCPITATTLLLVRSGGGGQGAARVLTISGGTTLSAAAETAIGVAGANAKVEVTPAGTHFVAMLTANDFNVARLVSMTVSGTTVTVDQTVAFGSSNGTPNTPPPTYAGGYLLVSNSGSPQLQAYWVYAAVLSVALAHTTTSGSTSYSPRLNGAFKMAGKRFAHFGTGQARGVAFQYGGIT